MLMRNIKQLFELKAKKLTSAGLLLLNSHSVSLIERAHLSTFCILHFAFKYLEEVENETVEKIS